MHIADEISFDKMLTHLTSWCWFLFALTRPRSHIWVHRAFFPTWVYTSMYMCKLSASVVGHQVSVLIVIRITIPLQPQHTVQNLLQLFCFVNVLHKLRFTFSSHHHYYHQIFVIHSGNLFIQYAICNSTWPWLHLYFWCTF